MHSCNAALNAAVELLSASRKAVGADGSVLQLVESLGRLHPSCGPVKYWRYSRVASITYHRCRYKITGWKKRRTTEKRFQATLSMFLSPAADPAKSRGNGSKSRNHYLYGLSARSASHLHFHRSRPFSSPPAPPRLPKRRQDLPYRSRFSTFLFPSEVPVHEQ